MTPRARVAIIAVAVVALVIAFVVAGRSGSGGSGSDTTSTAAAAAEAPAGTQAAPATSTPQPTTTAPSAPAPPVVRVVGGKPQGGVQRLTFKKGDRVRFTVRSDVADEIHVHGYDVKKNVPAGGSVAFSFAGKIDGRFDVELEGRHEQIALLEVTP